MPERRRLPLRAAAAALVPWLVAAALLPAAGCFKAVTISKPGSDAYLDAMAEATRHEHAGRLEEAVAAYDRAAAKADRRVDRDEAHYREARALEDLGRTDEALRLLDALAAERPVSRRTARATFDAALLRWKAGQRDAAHAGFRVVITKYPDSGLGGRALWYLVEDRRDAGGDAGALALLHSLYPKLRETTLGDDVLSYEADILLDGGDRAGARAALEKLVREHPYPQGHRWDDALVKLADLAEEDHDYRRAIGYLEALLERHDSTTMVGSYTLPSMPKAQLRIARIYRDDLKDMDAAASAFRKVGKEFPRSTLRDDAMLELGELRLAQGRRSKACGIFRDLVEDFEAGHARRLAEAHLTKDCPKD